MIVSQVIAHLVVALVVPPLLLGIIVKVKAVFAGRVGAPVIQLYRDLFKLVRKGSVFSTTTSWVFKAGPVVNLASVLVVVVLLPLGAHPAPLAFAGDAVLFAYLLGLGRFFTIIAALDTGSSFEGMGAAREATFSALAEPTLFLGLMVLVHKASSPSLDVMLAPDAVVHAWTGSAGGLVLVALSLFVVVLVENNRIPVDDPATHLELTMIHEVMVLDHSGPGLAAILYGGALKFFVLGTLMMDVVFPVSTGNQWTDWCLFAGAMMALAITVGIVESVMARLRLLHVPRLLIAASILSVFGLILAR